MSSIKIRDKSGKLVEWIHNGIDMLGKRYLEPSKEPSLFIDDEGIIQKSEPAHEKETLDILAEFNKGGKE